MATAEQAKALLKSYSEGNSEHFVSVALQIAARAARGGKGKLAQELRDLVDEIKRGRPPGRSAVPCQSPDQPVSLRVSYPKTRLSDMVLSDDSRTSLECVIVLETILE